MWESLTYTPCMQAGWQVDIVRLGDAVSWYVCRLSWFSFSLFVVTLVSLCVLSDLSGRIWISVDLLPLALNQRDWDATVTLGYVYIYMYNVNCNRFAWQIFLIYFTCPLLVFAALEIVFSTTGNRLDKSNYGMMIIECHFSSIQFHLFMRRMGKRSTNLRSSTITI